MSGTWADRLCEAIPDAWDRVVDTAVRHNVDFVVIAGDIFDSVRASFRDYQRFFQGLDRLDAEGIFVYMCTGNHDPLSFWQQDFFALPSSAVMLGADKPDFALFERDGQPLAIIAGRGYPNKVWSQGEDISDGITRAAAEEALGFRARQAPYGVGVLHTGLTKDLAKAPTDPVKLLQAGFDYWALGHIHRRWVNDPANPRLAFSGCIQGRDVRETGPRGVNLVTLNPGAPASLTFVPTASVVWEKVVVDATDCANIPALVSKALREQFTVNGDDYCEAMITRVVLQGTTPLHEVLQRPGVLEEVRSALNDAYSDFFCDAVIDETQSPVDERALRAEGLFGSVFLHAARSIAEDPAAEIDYLQEEFLARNIPLTAALSQERLHELSQQATRLVLDLLGREEGL